MTIRTFRQHAQGFGTVPAQVVYQIDGTTIFSGSVATVDQPVPTMPNLQSPIDNVAWSWQNDVGFSGTKSISVSVSNSPILLADTQANNPYVDVNTYAPFYNVEIDGVTYSDPFTDAAINGVPQTMPYLKDLAGQWWWLVPAGSTFTATLNVDPIVLPSNLVFGNIPTVIASGSTGTFEVSIVNEDPQRPYPRTFTWQIINGTSTDQNFDEVTGSMVFASANASFDVSTVAPNPAQSPVNFTVWIRNAQGGVEAVSNLVTIS